MLDQKLNGAWQTQRQTLAGCFNHSLQRQRRSRAAKQENSYLAVTKITPTEICVTDKILSGANANEDARRAADTAATKPCLKQK